MTQKWRLELLVMIAIIFRNARMPKSKKTSLHIRILQILYGVLPVIEISEKMFLWSVTLLRRE